MRGTHIRDRRSTLVTKKQTQLNRTGMLTIAGSRELHIEVAAYEGRNIIRLKQASYLPHHLKLQPIRKI